MGPRARSKLSVLEHCSVRDLRNCNLAPVRSTLSAATRAACGQTTRRCTVRRVDSLGVTRRWSLDRDPRWAHLRRPPRPSHAACGCAVLSAAYLARWEVLPDIEIFQRCATVSDNNLYLVRRCSTSLGPVLVKNFVTNILKVADCPRSPFHTILHTNPVAAGGAHMT